MPEGDTVFRTANHLARALAGQEITRFDIRVPGSATADLRGQIVRDVVPRGKHILHRIGEQTLHSHLLMEGEWHVYRPGAPWRKPAFKARAIVGTAEWLTVGFELAMVEVLPTSDESRVIGHLGPDPLSPNWDDAQAAEVTQRLAVDTRSVHVALLDQRNIAGFGNEYVNEMLFVRGIDPAAPARELGPTETLALVELGARMMRANLNRPGRTFTGNTRPGMATWVFGRAGKACRRCGARIELTTLGANRTSERNVFWCPSCQPKRSTP